MMRRCVLEAARCRRRLERQFAFQDRQPGERKAQQQRARATLRHTKRPGRDLENDALVPVMAIRIKPETEISPGRIRSARADITAEDVQLRRN